MLTNRKKADRAKMAAAVAKLATDLGAKATIVDGYGPRETRVEIEAARGLYVNVRFDGDSRWPDDYVLGWCVGVDSDACLTDAFGFGCVNPYHFRKATMIARGFDELCEQLIRALKMAADGSAFSPGRGVATIAKDGTAAERCARIDRAFDRAKRERAAND